MKKLKIVLAGLIIAGIFFAEHPARATCTNTAALSICYDKCSKLLDPALASACKLGCYIGCFADGSQ